MKLVWAALALAVAGSGVSAPAARPDGAAPIDLDVTADASACQRAAALELWQVKTPAEWTPPTPGSTAGLTSRFVGPVHGGTSYTRLASEAVADCHWRLSVAAGLYVVRLATADQPVASSVVTVTETSENLMPVRLAPAVPISGRVLYNGLPVRARGSLEGPIPSLPVEVVADEAGHFAVSVERPGDYTWDVQLSDDQRFPAVPDGPAMIFVRGHVRVVGGNSPVDLITTDGTDLTVDVRGWDGSTHTTVVAWSTTALRWAELTHGTRVRMLGIEPGDYEVVAYQDGEHFASAAPLRIHVTRGTATAPGTLTLAPNHARLELIGDVPFQVSVSVWVGPRHLATLTPDATGSYPIVGLPSGAELYIATPASAVPGCRLVPHDATTTFAVHRGRAVVVAFERKGLGGPLGALAGADGSDCPVPFNLFQYARIPPVDPGDLPHGSVANFPLTSNLIFNYQGLSQSTGVDSRGTIIIR